MTYRNILLPEKTPLNYVFSVLIKQRSPVKPVLQVIDIGNIGKDAIFERLVATRVKIRPLGSTLAFPALYQSLYEAIDATEPERSKLVCQFLTEWYGNMKPMYWYDCHKGPEGGGFFGYWALEVAGVVKAFDIDDSAFSDLPHYPGFN